MADGCLRAHSDLNLNPHAVRLACVRASHCAEPDEGRGLLDGRRQATRRQARRRRNETRRVSALPPSDASFDANLRNGPCRCRRLFRDFFSWFLCPHRPLRRGGLERVGGKHGIACTPYLHPNDPTRSDPTWLEGVSNSILRDRHRGRVPHPDVEWRAAQSRIETEPDGRKSKES